MKLLKAELLKLKRIPIFQMAILAPALVILLGVKFYSFFKLKMPQITPWEGLAASSLHMFIGVLLPVLMMYVLLMMGRIENLNNGWKQILVMPVKRGTVYLIKYLVVILVLIVALVSYLAQYTIAAYFLCAKGMIPVEMLVNVIYIFITLQPFVSLLFFLSNRFNSLALPIGVAMAFVLSSMIIVQSSYWKYAPWTYPLALVQGGLKKLTQVLPLLLISSLIFIIIFFLDMHSFKSKDVI